MKQSILRSIGCVVILLAMAQQSFAQPGKNGVYSVTTSTVSVNTYTRVTANVAAGATSITVANSDLTDGVYGYSLSPGDLILIMQMQGASVNTTNTTAYGEITSYNNAGLYEFACVSAVPGTTSITVTLPLMNAYSASGNTQVLRVPRFTSLTVATVGSIVAPAWNGATGGVVAIETTASIALSTASAINVSGRGFRGGALDNNSSTAGSGPITTYRSTSGNDGAEKGESIAGSATAYDVLNG